MVEAFDGRSSPTKLFALPWVMQLHLLCRHAITNQQGVVLR